VAVQGFGFRTLRLNLTVPAIQVLSNTNAINEMLKRVQHDKKKCVIQNQVLNLLQGLSFVLLQEEIVSNLEEFFKIESMLPYSHLRFEGVLF
jgi:hypothetical protein